MPVNVRIKLIHTIKSILRRMTKKTKSKELASLKAAFPNHKVTLKYNDDNSKTITLTKKLRQRKPKNVKQN